MWIMVAGPYRTGARSDEQSASNLRRLNAAACEIFRKGHVPVIGVNAALPVIDAAGRDSYEEIMMPLSLALAKRCDGILRIGGHSPGADQEVEEVRMSGGWVFKDPDEIPMADSHD